MGENKKMENIVNCFKYLLAGVATFITYLFGDVDVAVQGLILFMVLDFASGSLIGYVTGKWSSDTGFKGLARKCLIILVLIGAATLDRISGMEGWLFRTMVCYFYIANEGLSLLENAVILGLPVPEKLKDALIQLKDGNKKDVNKK